MDRFWQNLRRTAVFKVQYFAAVEPQHRLDPHLHAAMRGTIPARRPGQIAPPQPGSRLAAGHPQGYGLDPGEDCATIQAGMPNPVGVQAASVQWGDRGACPNSISPGIIMTPLALDELNSGAGEGYQRMIKASAAGRVGTPDEIGAAAAFLMGRDGTFITGTDLLIDGGVIAAIAAGRYQLTMGG